MTTVNILKPIQTIVIGFLILFFVGVAFFTLVGAGYFEVGTNGMVYSSKKAINTMGSALETVVIVGNTTYTNTKNIANGMSTIVTSLYDLYNLVNGNKPVPMAYMELLHLRLDGIEKHLGIVPTSEVLELKQKIQERN